VACAITSRCKGADYRRQDPEYLLRGWLAVWNIKIWWFRDNGDVQKPAAAGDLLNSCIASAAAWIAASMAESRIFQRFMQHLRPRIVGCVARTARSSASSEQCDTADKEYASSGGRHVVLGAGFISKAMEARTTLLDAAPAVSFQTGEPLTHQLLDHVNFGQALVPGLFCSAVEACDVTEFAAVSCCYQRVDASSRCVRAPHEVTDLV
jgi:hypothetical protein